jgi:hypothetical protein
VGRDETTPGTQQRQPEGDADEQDTDQQLVVRAEARDQAGDQPPAGLVTAGQKTRSGVEVRKT